MRALRSHGEGENYGWLMDRGGGERDGSWRVWRGGGERR